MILLLFELFTMLIVIDGGQAEREALKNNHFLQLKKNTSVSIATETAVQFCTWLKSHGNRWEKWLNGTEKLLLCSMIHALSLAERQ